jgi:hypothetical protein
VEQCATIQQEVYSLTIETKYMSEKNKALTDEFKKKKASAEENEKSGYADPTSFFGGPVTPISQMGPMKFEPRVTPKVKTPEERAEEEAMSKARAEIEYERKLEALKEANKNRPKTKTYVPSEKIGAKRTDPDYYEKRERWIAAFAAGAGGR